jgi:hypothetical protein
LLGGGGAAVAGVDDRGVGVGGRFGFQGGIVGVGIRYGGRLRSRGRGGWEIGGIAARVEIGVLRGITCAGLARRRRAVLLLVWLRGYRQTGPAARQRQHARREQRLRARRHDAGGRQVSREPLVAADRAFRMEGKPPVIFGLAQVRTQRSHRSLLRLVSFSATRLSSRDP